MMHEPTDILTSPDDSPRSECCNAVMVWIECENCDGDGVKDNVERPGNDADVSICRVCDGCCGEWTCPECQR